MTTEREMLDLLARRYTQRTPGTIADRWARAEHVRSSPQGTSKRIADLIVADKYNSTLALHGHEVKISRSDWLTELRDPEKAEAFRPFMHHWWLVVSDASIVHDGELPAGWGLIVKSGEMLRAKVKAPRQEPAPMPLELVIGLMAAAGRTAHREPLHRDAPVAFVKTWEPKCMWCSSPSPCALHQPRALAEQVFDIAS